MKLIEKNDPYGAPALLIASSSLKDPNFRRSVILLIEHNDEGAVGIVLNQASDAEIKELCQDQDIESDCTDFVRIGGPVSRDRVWVIHTPGEISGEAFLLTEDIAISVTREALSELAGLLAKNQETGLAKKRFLVCAGYAGWGPDQLEQEISEGAWIPYPVDSGTVFDEDPDQMWSRLTLSLGVFPDQAHDQTVN